jgi:hypothetical protein
LSTTARNTQIDHLFTFFLVFEGFQVPDSNPVGQGERREDEAKKSEIITLQDQHPSHPKRSAKQCVTQAKTEQAGSRTGGQSDKGSSDEESLCSRKSQAESQGCQS